MFLLCLYRYYYLVDTSPKQQQKWIERVKWNRNRNASRYWFAKRLSRKTEDKMKNQNNSNQVENSNWRTKLFLSLFRECKLFEIEKKKIIQRTPHPTHYEKLNQFGYEMIQLENRLCRTLNECIDDQHSRERSKIASIFYLYILLLFFSFENVHELDANSLGFKLEKKKMLKIQNHFEWTKKNSLNLFLLTLAKWKHSRLRRLCTISLYVSDQINFARRKEKCQD